jgi:hypothetical protein
MADGISLEFGVRDAFHTVLSCSHQVPNGYLLCSQFVPQVPISNTHYLICFAQTLLVHYIGCSKEKTRNILSILGVVKVCSTRLQEYAM